MNNTTKRRSYMAPTAELICLAPSSPIANSSGWKWSGGSSNSKWDNPGNHWLSDNSVTNILTNASVTGIATWIDYDANGNPINNELDK